MINGRIYSDKTIDNPSRYLTAVFGRYWTSMEREGFDAPMSVRFTASEEVRRLCEVSRNIEIIVLPTGGNRWGDGSPVPQEEPLLSADTITRW